MGSQPDVAVGVHQSGHQPGVATDRDGVSDMLGSHQAVNDPQVACHSVRQDDSVQVQPLSLRRADPLLAGMLVGEELGLTEPWRRVEVTHAPTLAHS